MLYYSVLLVAPSVNSSAFSLALNPTCRLQPKRSPDIQKHVVRSLHEPPSLILNLHSRISPNVSSPFSSDLHELRVSFSKPLELHPSLRHLDLSSIN